MHDDCEQRSRSFVCVCVFRERRGRRDAQPGERGRADGPMAKCTVRERRERRWMRRAWEAGAVCTVLEYIYSSVRVRRTGEGR